MQNLLMLLIRRTRLALQEFGPYMGLLMLPGGYLIALSGWVQRRWPFNTQRTYMRFSGSSRLTRQCGQTAVSAQPFAARAATEPKGRSHCGHGV